MVAVAVVMRFTGATLDQYDKVVELMGLTPEGEGAKGSLFHWVAATPDGIVVNDVWKTREAFEQFAQEQIGPHTQEAGFPAPPELTFYELHSYMSEG
jgi:hypothetical protein